MRVTLAMAAAAAAVSADPRRYAGDRIIVEAAGTICDVTSYGAVPDNKTDNTAAITAAWAACAAPGSTLRFPVVAGTPSTFSTGPIQAPGPLVNFAFEVAAGATLRFGMSPSSWPQPLDCITLDHGGSSIVFTGGGVVDGAGAPWWPNKKGFRPRMMLVEQGDGCSGLLFTNITFMNRCVRACASTSFSYEPRPACDRWHSHMQHAQPQPQSGAELQ